MSRIVVLAAISLIKEFESLHDGDLSRIGLQPKLDPVGIWTGGYGRALRNRRTGQFLRASNGRADQIEAYRQCEGLTEAGAEAWLREDLDVFADGVARLVKVPVTGNQFGALVSFGYNVGLDIDEDTRAEGLGDSTLLRFLNQGMYQRAADQFPLWNKAGGQALRGLARRRAAERALFLLPD